MAARTFIQTITTDSGLVTSCTASLILAGDLPAGVVSPLTAKGDLYTFDTADARLPAGSNGQILSADSTTATGLKWVAAGGTGTVTSVDLTVPAGFAVTGNPVTTAGTLAVAFANVASHVFLAGPSGAGTGLPTWRTIVAADLPTVPATIGGTGLTAYVLGDTIYGSGTNTLAVLAGNTTATRKFLRQTGTGTISAAPAWDTLVTGDLPAGTGTVTSVALSMPADMSVSGSPVTTSGTLTVTRNTQSANVVFAGPTTGSAAAPTYRALVVADLPTVNEAHGGTNQTTYATGDLLYASASNTLAKRAVGSTGDFLWVTGGVPAWRTLKGGDVTAQGCQVHQSANQSIANATFVNVPFDVEDADTDAFHEGVTNPTRITIPTGMGGWYSITATCVWTSNATGIRYLRVVKNNAVNELQTSKNAVNGDTTDQVVSGVLKLAAGDYLELFLKQTSGGALNALAGAPGSLMLAAFFLGK